MLNVNIRCKYVVFEIGLFSAALDDTKKMKVYLNNNVDEIRNWILHIVFDISFTLCIGCGIFAYNELVVT